jgi:hypothetical protein
MAVLIPAHQLPALPSPIEAAWHAATGDVSCYLSGRLVIVEIREVPEPGDPPIPAGEAATLRQFLRATSPERARARWLEEVAPLAQVFGPPLI